MAAFFAYHGDPSASAVVNERPAVTKCPVGLGPDVFLILRIFSAQLSQAARRFARYEWQENQQQDLEEDLMLERRGADENCRTKCILEES